MPNRASAIVSDGHPARSKTRGLRPGTRSDHHTPEQEPEHNLTNRARNLRICHTRIRALNATIFYFFV